MTFKKKGDLTVETFTQPAADGIPEVEVFRVHDIRGHKDMSRAGYEEYESRQSSRWAKGRYTLEEAAMQIVENTGADARTMLEKLVQAVRHHSLPVYGPNKIDLYKPEKVREWFEEVHWDDLNVWLADNEKRIEWRFPEPATLVTELVQSEAIASSTIETPPAWDTLTSEEKKASWDALSPPARREKATEMVKKHKGNKTQAAAEVGISRERIGQIIKEVKPKELEAPLPDNPWTQLAGLTNPKRGKASR